MNKITLKGVIRNITPSHTINTIEYDQANVTCSRKNGKSDLIKLKFKKYSNHFSEGDLIDITGNIRSYSYKLPTGKNKVDLYVFTYFDLPEEPADNHFEIDGRICKIEELRDLPNGYQNIHFILANNLILDESNQKLNSYLPCVAWNKLARKIASLKVNTKVAITGELQSREYKKKISEDEFEFRVAHELVIQTLEVIDE